MKKIFTLLSIILIGTYTHSRLCMAQEDNSAKILVSGTVNDIYTGGPVNAKVIFKNKSGNNFEGESHPKTGIYQVYLPAGGNYIVELHSPYILKKEERVKIKDIKVSDLQKIDFKVKLYSPGLIIDSSDFFNPGSDSLTDRGKYNLDYFNDAFKYNPKVSFAIYVTAMDSFGSNSTPEKAKELIDKRVASIEQAVSKWNMGGRLKILPDYNAVPTGKTKKPQKDIYVKVEGIEK